MSWPSSEPRPNEFLIGTVLDKISEVHGRVSPGWVRSSTGNAQDVVVNETNTYYMVAEEETGVIHRLSPHKILKVLEIPKP